ncbi:MAG: sulfatase modifying factor 1 [Planctomycetota bacterium]|jgi:sulfatase modifying factor 1
MSADAKFDPSTDPLLSDLPVFDGYCLLPPCAIRGPIGRGGMGVVYRGQHIDFNIDVAVKCLDPALAKSNPSFIERFQQEARSAAQINHQNVVRVFTIGEAHGLHYLVMEYVEGETANERVRRKGPLDISEALQIALNATRGLASAHKAGLVHRDVKPDNILISPSGEVKLADLGLAKSAAAEGGMTHTGTVLGTPKYMPLEQWRSAKAAGPPADVYSMGATLWFLLVGRDAIKGGAPLEVLERVSNEAFPDLAQARPDVPAEIVEIVQRCTQKLPEDRFASAVELVEALEAVTLANKTSLVDAGCGSQVIAKTLVSPPPQKTLTELRVRFGNGEESETAESSSKTSGIWKLAVATLVIASIAFGLWWKDQQSEEPSPVPGSEIVTPNEKGQPGILDPTAGDEEEQAEAGKTEPEPEVPDSDQVAEPDPVPSGPDVSIEGPLATEVWFAADTERGFLDKALLAYDQDLIRVRSEASSSTGRIQADAQTKLRLHEQRISPAIETFRSGRSVATARATLNRFEDQARGRSNWRGASAKTAQTKLEEAREVLEGARSELNTNAGVLSALTAWEAQSSKYQGLGTDLDWTALNWSRAELDLALTEKTKIADTDLAEGHFRNASIAYRELARIAQQSEATLIQVGKLIASRADFRKARTELATLNLESLDAISKFAPELIEAREFGENGQSTECYRALARMTDELNSRVKSMRPYAKAEQNWQSTWETWLDLSRPAGSAVMTSQAASFGSEIKGAQSSRESALEDLEVGTPAALTAGVEKLRSATTTLNAAVNKLDNQPPSLQTATPSSGPFLLSDQPTVRLVFDEALSAASIAGQSLSITGKIAEGRLSLSGAMSELPWKVTDLFGNSKEGILRVSLTKERAPSGWNAVGQSVGEDGWFETVVDPKSGIVFKLIPSGTFLMGSPESEESRGSDETQHWVKITKPFYMAETETTQEQWRKVMGTSPSHFSGSNRPVEQVSWTEAKEFCEKIGGVLPTESQWEYACRAGTSTPFSFGATISTSQANYNGNYTYGSGEKGSYREKTTDVRSFSANGWGLFDMHGNVWEWCSDGFGDYPSGSRSSPARDPKGSSSASSRMLRGGCWYYDPRYLRAAYRGYSGPGGGNYFLGFRVSRIP